MNSRTGRKSIISFEFFSNPSPERDYILGLLCTDGTIGSSDYTISIGLKDREILESISKLTNVPIYSRLDKRYNTYMYTWRFRNKQIHKFLLDLGITPNKTKTL